MTCKHSNKNISLSRGKSKTENTLLHKYILKIKKKERREGGM